MALCRKCGNQFADNVKFCPACGAPADPPGQQPKAEDPNDLSAKLTALNDTADTTGEFDPQDIARNKVMAVLAYLGLLVLVPIFGAKESKFARYHANQGLTLLLASVVWSIVSSILSSILVSISWRLAFVGSLLSLVSLVFLVLAIIGIVNAANGKAKELPVIGKIKLLK